MANFFNELISESLINDWASILDWLFDDNRFPKEKNWNKNKVGLFTKRVKKIDGISNDNFQHKSQQSINFPKHSNGRKSLKISIILAKQNSAGRDLIQHIRNGIAHGNTKIHKKKENIYIEIIDYNSNKKSQTAYINMRIDYISQIHKIYCDIEKSLVKKHN